MPKYEFEPITGPSVAQANGQQSFNSSQEGTLEFAIQQKAVLTAGKCAPPKRYVFTALGFWGMVCLYALRVNLSVAIVSMVKSKGDINSTAVAPGLPANFSTSQQSSAHGGEFEWDEKTQALVLGSFFWGYVVFQLPGGQLADKVGAKWLLGVSICATSLLTLLSPLAARLHYSLFIVCRVLEGLFEGCAVPSMHSMIAKWYPANERSTAAGIIYSGMSIGTVLTMPIAAFLCESASLGGWPSVFYAFGLAGILWSLLWAVLITETPQQHPTISQHELRLILSGSPNHSATRKKGDIPWRSILTSVPVWALTLTHFGQHWGFYTLLTQLPRYFKELGFDLQSNGLYSALPYLSQALAASSIGIICDRLYRSGRYSLGTLRKSFNSIAYGGNALCLFLLTLSGRDHFWNIFLLTAALGINGIGMAGFTVTHVDMSPNYAGTLMGLTNTVANLAGILMPLMVGEIMATVVGAEVEHSEPQLRLLAWHYVFYAAAAIFTFTGLIFLCFGANTVQPWNEQPKKAREARA